MNSSSTPGSPPDATPHSAVSFHPPILRRIAGLIRPLLLALLSVLLLPRGAQCQEQGAKVVLKPNDSIRMVVFGEDDLTSQTRILKGGDVVLPLVGTVKIGGLTVTAANETIRALYAKDYLVDPKITLTVEEYSKEFVSVIGAVRAPGDVPIPANGKFDLASALAGAGGLTPDADPNSIGVMRSNGDVSTYSAATAESGKRVELRPGDRVTVQQSAYVNKSVTVLGQVGKPGAIVFPISGKLDLVGAIAQAGGMTELANAKKVNVNRKGKVITLNVKEMTDKGAKPYALLPDDIVTVTERFF